MSDMVEKVAKALCYDDGLYWTGPLGSRPVSRERYRRRARIAIEAMRDPTSEMIDAGCIAIGTVVRSHKAYTKMVEAALGASDT